MAWIKLETHTFSKVEVFQISSILKLNTDETIGKLCKIWAWFDINTRNGVTPKVTLELLDSYVNCSGFCAAMISAGWMSTDDNNVFLPHYDRHNSQTAKDRALSSIRMAKKRNAVTEELRCERNLSVTREEKRREENILLSADKKNENNNLFYNDRLIVFSTYPLIEPFYDAIRKYNDRYPIVDGLAPAIITSAETNLQSLKDKCAEVGENYVDYVLSQINYSTNSTKLANANPLRTLSDIALYGIKYLSERKAKVPKPAPSAITIPRYEPKGGG